MKPLIAARAVGIRASVGTKKVLGLIAGGREAKGESQVWRGCRLLQSGADGCLPILGSYVDC